MIHPTWRGVTPISLEWDRFLSHTPEEVRALIVADGDETGPRILPRTDDGYSFRHDALTETFRDAFLELRSNVITLDPSLDLACAYGLVVIRHDRVPEVFAALEAIKSAPPILSVGTAAIAATADAYNVISLRVSDRPTVVESVRTLERVYRWYSSCRWDAAAPSLPTLKSATAPTLF